MTSNLTNQLIGLVFSGTIAYTFWTAYKDPAKDRLTRLVHRYAEAILFPNMSVAGWLLLQTVICAAVAVMCLGFAIAEVWQLTRGAY